MITRLQRLAIKTAYAILAKYDRKGCSAEELEVAATSRDYLIAFGNRPDTMRKEDVTRLRELGFEYDSFCDCWDGPWK